MTCVQRAFGIWLGMGVAVMADFDWVIRGGLVVDGSGEVGKVMDVAIQEGRVVAVGEGLGPAGRVLDATGMVVAPGFIDVHTHSEGVGRLPLAENFLRMGVTTIVTGNCGSSVTDVAAFFEQIEGKGLGVNVATLIGHNSVRRQVMGGSFLRAPSGRQLEEMTGLVSRAMRDGALGLSTGLIYTPGTFAKTDEIVALARAAAAEGGIYVSHMRHETVKIFEALEELIEIASKAECAAHVSHIKLSGPTAWGQAEKVLARLDLARSAGLKITHDQYAYTASSTGLRQVIPSSAREGSLDDYRARLADPEKKAEIMEGMRRMREAGGRDDYDYVAIASYEKDPELNGLRIPAAARLRRGSDSVEDQMELLLEMEANGGGSGIYHSMNEEDLEVFMRHPLTMVASDGGPRELGKDLPHPRSYGNNARVLGRYVRERKVQSVEEAVRRMTSLPADVFQLKGRGRLAVGAVADVVVFDPEKVEDPADFNDPHHYAVGFKHVLVNGEAVIENEMVTELRPGRAVRRGE